MVDVRETGVCGRGAAGADRGDVQDRLRLDVRGTGAVGRRRVVHGGRIGGGDVLLLGAMRMV